MREGWRLVPAFLRNADNSAFPKKTEQIRNFPLHVWGVWWKALWPPASLCGMISTQWQRNMQCMRKFCRVDHLCTVCHFSTMITVAITTKTRLLILLMFYMAGVRIRLRMCWNSKVALLKRSRGHENTSHTMNGRLDSECLLSVFIPDKSTCMNTSVICGKLASEKLLSLFCSEKLVTD